MSKITRKSLLSAASAFTIAAFSAPIAYAQDAETTQTESTSDETKTLDTIVVTGIRASLAQSVLDKRNADQIVDTINAEDIGKSTDQNIAEALNRISGVSINTEDGEGSTISIRGANANQTVVTLNGATLGSTDFSQGVDLSAYSADILSKVEVIKTPSADDEEGSLAGLVNLSTRKPLDLDENVRTVTVQGRYNDLSDDTNYKFSGTASHKFFNDKLGVIATIYDETNTVRRDEIFFEDYNAFGSNAYTDQNGNVFVAQPAIDAEAAQAAENGRESVFAGATGVDAAGAYSNIITGLAPTTSGYELHKNERSRTGIDLVTQWQMTDKTDLTFNLTYNKQKFDNEMDGISVGTSALSGHIDGVAHPNLFLPPSFTDRTTQYDSNITDLGGTVANPGDPVTNPTANDGLLWTDPVQDWRVYNTDTRTWDTHLSRHALGSTRASVNNYETENYLVGAELNHEFTDAFRVKAGVSQAKSEQTPDQNIFIIANRSRTIGLWNLHHVPADLIQPSGYDCSGGSCNLVGGTATPFLGNVVEFEASLNDLWDNIGRTGFNPDDLPSHTLSYLQSTVTEVSDERTVAFADFDWDVDFGGITSFEFGGKYTKQEKFVDDQQGTPRASADLVESISPFTGETIFVDPSNINLISAAIFADGQVNAPGFLEGLDVASDNLTDGWITFDPALALSTITTDDRDFNLDNTRTRGAEFENFAAYLKTNFSYMDDRIRGDIGVRYVKSEVSTNGFAGASFAFDNEGRRRIIDPIHLHNLRNSDQANQCAALPEAPDPRDFGTGSQYWAPQTGVDGVDPTDTTNLRNYDIGSYVERNTLARVDGLCYDPLLEAGQIPGTLMERYLVRYSDLSTEQRDTVGTLGILDRNLASVAASDSHEYEVFLPNLNVSFAATDNLIARFSAYKTMSRPPIDDLRAGFSMTEGSVNNPNYGTTNFRTDSNIELFGAGIDPLEANNFDLSVEWYFDKDALLSVNLFRKDISNLIETQDARWFIGDLRRIAADPDNASVDGLTFTNSDGVTTDLLLTNSADLAAQPDINNCMPRRLQGEGTLSDAQSWLYSGDGRALCNEYNVRTRENANDATVDGVEFQYTQNYTFLPGLLSGLGLTANYTYQDGKFEQSGLPVPGTPKDSYNATLYWQEGGHQLRLAYAGSSDQLVTSSFEGGAEWREGRDTLDFSAAYQLSDNLSLSFQASNLTDAPVRTYWTSRLVRLPDANGNLVTFDEGSAFDNAPTSRTLREYNTGRIFRLGLRAEF